MSGISAERLAELIDWHASGIKATAKLDTVDALRELQQARELIATIAAQSSGVPTSTSRSDCMAALAMAHMRNHGQKAD